MSKKSWSILSVSYYIKWVKPSWTYSIETRKIKSVAPKEKKIEDRCGKTHCKDTYSTRTILYEEININLYDQL